MQRGLAGSEQGTATERNSAGTCQPLMHGKGLASCPTEQTGNWESSKYYGNRENTADGDAG